MAGCGRTLPTILWVLLWRFWRSAVPVSKQQRCAGSFSNHTLWRSMPVSCIRCWWISAALSRLSACRVTSYVTHVLLPHRNQRVPSTVFEWPWHNWLTAKSCSTSKELLQPSQIAMGFEFRCGAPAAGEGRIGRLPASYWVPAVSRPRFFLGCSGIMCSCGSGNFWHVLLSFPFL